ncbi:carboxypeptidase-like regulatory domain-containing protein, partial [Cecembia sp.]|uniref:carboxypeptidase-like regulatory domain-containing protein n=1 Tax=Cecembia sp. TaxID=1898110 RepID=UPI0025BEEB29
MKYTFLFAMFFVFIGALAAQDLSLSGKVVDKSNNNPLPGVNIYVPELNRGVVTDLDGKFILTGIPERNITLQVSFLGYATLVKSVRVNAVKDLVFELEEYAQTIEEVVVSGAYIMSKESSPISIEKVDRVDLLKMPSPNLMSSLARTPGVSEISLGPGISKPVIRGLSFSRVLSLYQGARFENQQWGADHGLGMTETGIANVEMIKGPASIIYGSGAMAGVVNLIEERDA